MSKNEEKTCTTLERSKLEREIIEKLKEVYDPEIPVNIYDLGLIYEVKVHEDHTAYIQMTLTAPNCPAAEMLPVDIETAARSVPGVGEVDLDLTFEPTWHKDMMSDAAKLELGLL